MAFGTSLDTGLDSYYSFDVDTTDDSGNGWELGAGSGLPQPVQVSGILNNGYYFNGGNFDADPGMLRVAYLDSWAFSLWIYRGSTDWESYEDLLYGYPDTYASLHSGIPSLVDWGGWPGGELEASGALSKEAWHHLVFSFDDTTKEGYIVIDGDWVGRSTMTFGNTVQLSPASYGFAAIDTIVDEMGLWNRALTQVEVEALYNGGAGLSYFGAGPAEPIATTGTCGHKFLVQPGQQLTLELARAAQLKIYKRL